MSKYTQEIESYLLLHTPEVGSKSLLQLKKYAESYTSAVKIGEKGWNRAGLTTKQIASIKANSISEKLAILRREQIDIALLGEVGYPALLAEIPDPPTALYVKGNIQENQRVSIVGTRQYTSYGKTITQQIGESACSLNLSIVSGLAIGIDSIAHQVALDMSKTTLAVMPCGLEQIYPVSHRQLATQIVESGGALISEFPIGMPIYKGNFLMRNRIIAGLSEATIVTEAGLKSGALLTARLANDYNRDVFAVPGDINRPTSEGTNALLQNGAILITNGKELADHYRLERNDQQVPTDLTHNEQLVLKTITSSTTLEQLSERLLLDFGLLSSTVVMLELKGLLMEEGRGTYRRKRGL